MLPTVLLLSLSLHFSVENLNNNTEQLCVNGKYSLLYRPVWAFEQDKHENMLPTVLLLSLSLHFTVEILNNNTE